MQDILAFSLSLNLQLDDLPWNISVMKTSPKKKSLIFIDGRVWCKNKWICTKYGAINHGAWLAPFSKILTGEVCSGAQASKRGAPQLHGSQKSVLRQESDTYPVWEL